jgi:hypothetical protein
MLLAFGMLQREQGRRHPSLRMKRMPGKKMTAITMMIAAMRKREGQCRCGCGLGRR